MTPEPSATVAPTLETLLAELMASTQEVFGTVIGSALDATQPVHGGVMTAPCGVHGTIPFAGECSGSVAFYSAEETAVKITSVMMGVSPAEVNDEMPDAIGEITNMIAGTFRTKMAALGTRWAISTPSVTVGQRLRTISGLDCDHDQLPWCVN